MLVSGASFIPRQSLDSAALSDGVVVVERRHGLREVSRQGTKLRALDTAIHGENNRWLEHEK